MLSLTACEQQDPLTLPDFSLAALPVRRSRTSTPANSHEVISLNAVQNAYK